ncbi:universal stress protein [Kitasatospora sp. NA04385]|nr:universal stress protein [Kitasatospora sp. NA04385]
MTQKIVSGYDGSPRARAATRWAAEEAARRGAELTLLRVWPWLGAADPEGPGADPVQQAEHDELEALAADLLAAYPDLAVATQAAAGDPADILVEAATGYDLAVLGSGGPGAAADLLGGSVALSVAARATCPVVLVRERPADEDAQLVEEDAPLTAVAEAPAPAAVPVGAPAPVTSPVGLPDGLPIESPLDPPVHDGAPLGTATATATATAPPPAEAAPLTTARRRPRGRGRPPRARTGRRSWWAWRATPRWPPSSSRSPRRPARAAGCGRCTAGRWCRCWRPRPAGCRRTRTPTTRASRSRPTWTGCWPPSGPPSRTSTCASRPVSAAPRARCSPPPSTPTCW